MLRAQEVHFEVLAGQLSSSFAQPKGNALASCSFVVIIAIEKRKTGFFRPTSLMM